MDKEIQKKQPVNETDWNDKDEEELVQPKPILKDRGPNILKQI